MEENTSTKKGFNPVTIGYVLILLGVVALVLSYVMVFSKYKDKNAELKTKIDEQQNVLNDYNSKNKQLKQIKKETEENQERIDKVMSRFDGGLCYEAEVCDAIKLSESADVTFDSLTFSGDESTDVYYFGNDTKVLDSDGKQGSLTTTTVVDSANDVSTTEGTETEESDENTPYVGTAIQYSLAAKGTYDNALESLREIEETEGKRKVLTSLSFTYDVTADVLAYDASFTEFAIKGGGREPYKYEIPAYAQGVNNIFYSQAIPTEEK